MDIAHIVSQIERGTAEIINHESLVKKLQQACDERRSLRVKAGFDPTASDIHLGHVVLLRKLRQFQNLGHRVLFLIGDFTAQIGDPTGRDQLRPRLTAEQIQKNAQTYQSQVSKILDPQKTDVVFNSTWLAALPSQKLLELTMHTTVAQMLARADFKKRFEQGKEISLLEFAYPLLQGYDSVHLKADIELGGSDQKFNLLMGRHLQEVYGQDPQVVIMTPLLEGTDGVQKMSKSLGNYIGITEEPAEIFGKVMSISDGLMYRYFEFLTDCDLAAVQAMHPKEAKLKLGREIVAQFYDEKTADHAQKEFERVFSRREIPEEIATYYFDQVAVPTVGTIAIEAKLVESKNELRRLLKQDAVTIDGNKISDENGKAVEGILKIGKRRFLKLSPRKS